MKIYFTASVTGKDKFTRNYKEIVRHLSALGHQVVADHILKVNSDDLVNQSVEQREKHFQNVKHWLNTCDIVVSEVSYSSTNVGYELSMALDREKPVLALHTKDHAPILLVGVLSDKFLLGSYELHDLKRILKESLEDLKEQTDVRFNFFVPPKIVAYLDWVAKNKKLPRAVYLRKLIEEDMKKNPQFNNG